MELAEVSVLYIYIYIDNNNNNKIYIYEITLKKLSHTPHKHSMSTISCQQILYVTKTRKQFYKIEIWNGECPVEG